jgi:hypothetical protein
MRSGVVGTSSWKEAKWSSQCPSAIGCSKPSMLALLHDTAPLDRQLHSLHCFYLRTWTERDCGSHLLATKRPSDGGSRDLGRPRAVPLLKPRHMFCTLGMPTSVDSSLFEGPGDDVSRYMSLSVVCNSRACWTSTYRKVQHTVQYMYISSRTAQWFTILLLLLLHSPASPHPHPASTSLSPFNLSPAHMHARLSAR